MVEATQQQAGSIRGVVYDQDFDVPLGAATVLAIPDDEAPLGDRKLEATTSDQGNYVIPDVAPGTYTVVFSKPGYDRKVTRVVVSPGQLVDAGASLSGEFTDMEEFVVQDIMLMGGGTEAALLELRFQSPALMDSIGSDLMNRAGVSDAAGALRLVAGATVADGKSAVIRGLPDRYVSTQLNGVRLPTADEDKRAVELDQFPSTVIESVQVSKTFTPDQQGDASGGAVNVRLKGVPEQSTINFKVQTGRNSQVSAAGDDFLSYDGGGVGTWGREGDSRAIQTDNLGSNWDGAVGVSPADMPPIFKWSAAGGHKHTFGNGLTLGGYANFFYERDASYYDNGVNDSYWVESPGGPMVPETTQGTPEDGDFRTKLFDITQGSQSVQWGGLAAIGVQTENHQVSAAYLYTRTTEDTATLATDTRSKEYFFPGYDPDDINSEGNSPNNLNAAPYLRTETLEYTERTTGSLIFNGQHRFPTGKLELGNAFAFSSPELEWIVADSSATLDQPDKRQFGALWLPPSLNPGAPPFLPPFKTEPVWLPFKPAANFNLGNLQRIYKNIAEDSFQYSVNLKVPFEQWAEEQGYLKFGLFDDDLERQFEQETFSNFGDASANQPGTWDNPWSETFPPGPEDGTFTDPSSSHPISESLLDVDYNGTQKISAWYAMMDLPLFADLSLIGGARVESTDLQVVNDAEEEATWFPPGATAPVTLNPGDADVDFQDDAVLPSVGLEYRPTGQLTVRGSYSQTLARQTFKELTPIIQQEFLGAPIFIGNPELQTSSLDNFDVRVDYAPYQGGLISASWFQKDITDAIEYVQRLAGFVFTTPVNYPRGDLSGFELEFRQSMDRLWDGFEGLAVGANATFISSEVFLPEEDAAGFELPSIDAPMRSRDMTNAPEHLYNFYVTYDFGLTQTQAALFYTVTGDTLVVGAGQAGGNFVPNIYAKEFGTLNLSIAQRLGEYFRLQVQAKNLTNPAIQTVYRSDYIESDVLNTSFTAGIDVSISLSAAFSF